MMCVFHSGKWESLWLRQAAGNADQSEHGGPARADSHPPLWAVPSLQTGGDGLQGHGPWQQALQVRLERRPLPNSWTSAYCSLFKFCIFLHPYIIETFLPLQDCISLCLVVFVCLLIVVLPFSFVSLQETYEAKRNEFMGELQKKEEEMRQMFVQRVKEKEAELKEAEKEVRPFIIIMFITC